MLRSAGIEDADRLAPLLDNLGYAAGAQQVSERLSRLLADQTYAAWVCVLDGGIVGFAAGHLIFPIENDTPAAQLIALVTAEHVRGQGVGSALGREFEEWAKSRGATRAIVNSGSQRLGAHAFYTGQGYATTGVRFGKRLSSPNQ